MHPVSLGKPIESHGEPRLEDLEPFLDPQTTSQEGVSVDQLVSVQPGLIPRSSGKLTRSRIWAATVFMDYFTNFLYVHLMRYFTLESTLEYKDTY